MFLWDIDNIILFWQDAKSGVYYKEFSSDVPSENTVIQGEKRDFSSNYAGFSMSSPKYMIIITWNKMELSKNPRANAEVRTKLLEFFFQRIKESILYPFPGKKIKKLHGLSFILYICFTNSRFFFNDIGF